MEVDIHRYLDERNADLYKAVSEFFKITLVESPELLPCENNGIWQCTVNGDKATILFYNETENTSHLTHELLHLDLLIKGFADMPEFKEFLRSSEFKNLFFTGILGHINNIFAHQKFYDEFIKLGYNKEEFTSDYDIDPGCEGLMSQIQQNFSSDTIPNESIQTYLTSYFSAKDNKNDDKEGEYQNLLTFLRNLDRNLYDILEEHWDHWLSGAVSSNKIFIQSMFLNIEEWHKNRKQTSKEQNIQKKI